MRSSVLSANSAPVLTFVVPVRDDAARLRRCLASIRASASLVPFEIIVADNGSKDDSPQVAAALGATVLSLPNLTVGELRNAAAGAGTGELIAFVDADHELDRDWARAALRIFDDPCTAAAGAPYASPADANRVQRAYGHLRTIPERPQVTQWLGSGNLVVRRKAFDALGGFDTTLEACEDVDFCNRLAAAGHRLLADPALRSVHRGDPSTLRAVFRGELWRGRNNMRVTLRGPLTPRALVSLLIPMAGLMCLTILALSPAIGWQAGALAAGAFAALTLLRTARMSAAHPPDSIVDIIDNLSVALAYDAARALALVFRATHRTRRDLTKERVLV